MPGLLHLHDRGFVRRAGALGVVGGRAEGCAAGRPGRSGRYQRVSLRAGERL